MIALNITASLDYLNIAISLDYLNIAASLDYPFCTKSLHVAEVITDFRDTRKKRIVSLICDGNCLSSASSTARPPTQMKCCD